MKRILLLLISLFWIGEATAQAPGYIFFDGTYEQLQTRAANAKLPYFVYFYANWSMQSKEMNDNTFHNKYVLDYMRTRYLGVQLDGESIISEGRKLADHFGIVYYPTVILFSPYGKELKRMYGYTDPTAFLVELRKYEASMAKPGEGENTTPKPIYTPKDGEYLFKMNVRKQAYEGYGVQVGVFGDYRNAFLRLLELEEDYGQRNVLVHIQEGGLQTLFKLVLGPFDSKVRADNYHKLIEKKGIKGMVVTLDDMQ